MTSLGGRYQYETQMNRVKFARATPRHIFNQATRKSRSPPPLCAVRREIATHHTLNPRVCKNLHGSMAEEFTLQRESRNTQGGSRLSDGILEIFQDYLKPTTSVSAAEAARAVDELAPQGRKEEVDNFVWDTWGNFFQIAQQIPSESVAQCKLARVLRELSLLPDGGSAGWQQLPQLGWVLRDWFNFTPAKKDVDSEHADAILQSWVNVNAFWARLGGTGVHSTVDFAIWALRSTLEDQDAPDVPKLLDNRVLTAAQYVEYEGHILHQQLALGWKPRDNEAQMYKGGPLFDGESGLSHARWEFWIVRFRELAEKMSTAEAKSAAVRAANLLEAVHVEE